MPEPTLLTAPIPRFASSELRGFERVAVPALHAWNQSPLAKRAVYLFVRYISHTWIQAVTRNRLAVLHAERVQGLNPERGVLLVANHRTFWDMYVASSVLQTSADFIERLYFPVRARFFYDHPVGVLVNGAVSGGSMWPPMFEGFGRQRLNQVGLEQVAHVLGEQGSLVGIHPEGTRNKGAEPLELLKARGGIGRVLKACHPDVVVLPYFLQGVTNDLLAEVRLNFRAPGQRGAPIALAWGEPMRVGDMDLSGPPVVIARGLLEQVRQLGVAIAEADLPRP